jgi:hypothetical protein
VQGYIGGGTLKNIRCRKTTIPPNNNITYWKKNCYNFIDVFKCPY